MIVRVTLTPCRMRRDVFGREVEPDGARLTQRFAGCASEEDGVRKAREIFPGCAAHAAEAVPDPRAEGD